MNFVICGLPRSGTTIIARFVGGLPGVYVMHEPFQVIGKYGCHLPCPKPEQFKHIGIKEPFHCNPRIAACENVEYLKVLKDLGWRFIWVCRESGWVDSIKKWGVSDAEALAMMREFDKFRDYEQSICYECFCEDPVGYWNQFNPLGIKATEVKLAPCPELMFMGDWKARASAEILKP